MPSPRPSGATVGWDDATNHQEHGIQGGTRPVSGNFSVIPTPRRTTDEEDRIRHGLLRFVRDAVEQMAPLPGEMELIGRLDCSRQQLRHALAELERQGILHRRQGAATTVDPVALRMSVRLEEQFEHSELLSRMGYSTHVEVISTSNGPLPDNISVLLESGLGGNGAHSVKRWFADGVPAMVAEDTMVLPPGGRLSAGESVFTAVVQVWNESIIWEIATPGVVLLDERMADLLGMAVGSPAMTLELVGVSASGRRLFHSLEYHRPDLVKYSVVRTVRPPWSTT
jgi:GntR family transcriptional regulator